MTEAEIIAIIDNYLLSLATKRIPELPPYSNTGDHLTLSDKLPVWRADTNKTVQTTLQQLKDLIISIDGGILTPEQIGSSIVVVAGTAEVGTDTFYIPSLAGKEFLLRKVGYGTLRFKADESGNLAQYEMLSSGGFKLKLGAIIQDTDQFEIQLVDASFNQLTPSSSNKLFKGVVIVTSSITLNPTNHLGKLIQARPTSAGVAAKLPDIDDVEEDTIVAFESMINCPYEFEINTTGGQYIYHNGTSRLKVFLRKGEWIWFYRGTDGWYVLFASPAITQVGMVLDGYSVGSDELALDGGNISAAAYPRFTEWIMGLPDSVKDAATRNLAQVYEKAGVWSTTAPAAPYNTILKPYRGCFGRDIGSDVIILPDFTDMFTRVLGEDATKRYANVPGGYQKDEMPQIDITLPIRRSNNNYALGTSNGPILDLSNTTLNETVTIPGGTETRSQNIGLFKKIKV